MGMFDEIRIPCPVCSRIFTEQSKAGPCELKQYTLDTAPPEILADIRDNTFDCAGCGTTIGLVFQWRVQAVVQERRDIWDGWQM